MFVCGDSTATFIVNSLSDDTDASVGVLTLRETADLADATFGKDVIKFHAGAGGTILGGGLIRSVQGTIGLSDQAAISGGSLITITGNVNGEDGMVALQKG